jgi:hypothetical protein
MINDVLRTVVGAGDDRVMAGAANSAGDALKDARLVAFAAVRTEGIVSDDVIHAVAGSLII